MAGIMHLFQALPEAIFVPTKRSLMHPQRHLVLFTVLTASAMYPLWGQERTPAEEVTFITNIRRVPDRDRQVELRSWSGWPVFKAAHPRWSAEFNEETGLPRRAYGDPIATSGSSAEERARNFLAAELAPYQLPMAELVHAGTAPHPKLTYVHFTQQHEGLPVLGSRAMVKLDGQQRVISFSTDIVKDIQTSLVPSIGAAQAIEAASSGLANVTGEESEGLGLLPVPAAGRNDVRLVHRVTVHTRSVDTPGRYKCLVDAHTGRLLYRSNEVVNCEHGSDEGDAGVDVSVTALAYTGSPLDAPVVQGLPELDVTVGGNLFRTDITGFLGSGIPGPAPGIFQLRGRWADVKTNGTTASFNQNLNEGPNDVNFNTAANVRERSAYLYVNQIHAHVRNVLPDFTGMDFQMPTNLDLITDNCNAFYDGSSINFYAEANNCRSLATINDVVYHEYGHGINDKFYQSLSSNFVNGAMNEGYADVWALTLTQNPVLGLGINLDDPASTVRRYDQEPKVYPVDIVGQVHNDGEIICGAWWTTYEELGNNMDLTLDLFELAFPGLQANTFNGNEGQAYRDVLLDVLQADDDDGDITNGTPNGGAIVEAFGRHGITLISDAQLFHSDLLTAPVEEAIELEAELVITFPSTEYLQDASLFYKVNDAADWTVATMSSSNGSTYSAAIPPQPAGTVISYYMGLRDIFGLASSITPIGADREDPGLPYYMLVGYGLAATENADDLNELGVWQEGVAEDNAVTGLWEFGPPLASYGTPGDISTIVQTGTQHTEGGEYCWYTGNANSITDGIGTNDVDGGSTTLMGPNINLSAYANPAISYWRWYTNNPPSGANPNADWWQVYASGDNGNTWVPVEDTKSGERNWRRKAFRVQDVLGEVGQIRLKFIASDSLRPGTELDGGSLVEGAVDDIQLWSAAAEDGVEERMNERALAVWPTPSQGPLTVDIRMAVEPGMSLDVLDLTGRTVMPLQAVREGVVRMDVSGLSDGEYLLRLRFNGGSFQRRFTILH